MRARWDRIAAAALGALAVLPACTRDDGELRLDLPVADVHHAVIVAAWPSGHPDEVVTSVREVRADLTILPIALPYAREAGIELAAALYSATLDELFVSEGTVSLGTADPGRPVPSTAEVYAASVRAGEGATWQRVSAAPPGLAAARLPAVDDCPELEVTPGQITGARDPYFVLGVRVDDPPDGLSGHGVLVGYQDRRVFYVEGAEVRELVPPPPGAACGSDRLDRALYYGGYQEPDGAVWLAARCGELHRAKIDLLAGRLDGGLTRSMLVRDTAGAVAGPKRGPVTTIHAMSELGEVDRVDTAGLATLLLAVGHDGDGALVHLADDEAAAVWTPVPEVVRMKGADVVREPLPVADPATVEVRRLALGDQLGLVAGASDGSVYYARSGTWRPLGAPRGGAIAAIVPHGGSAAVLDDAGSVHLFAPARGTWCPATPLPDGAALGLHLLAVTDGAMLVAGRAGAYVWIAER